MPRLAGPFGVGAFFVLLSAILHVVAVAVSAFAPGTLILLPVAVVYFLIVAGLTRSMRWLAYIAFLVMGIGSIAAFGMLWSATGTLYWTYLLILIADLGAMAALFSVLWRARSDISVS